MKTWSKARKPSDYSDDDSDNENTSGTYAKKGRRKTRFRSDDAFKYLEARSAQETALRKEELQLQKEKRELDEQKIQLEQAKFDQVKEQMQQSSNKQIIKSSS